MLLFSSDITEPVVQDGRSSPGLEAQHKATVAKRKAAFDKYVAALSAAAKAKATLEADGSPADSQGKASLRERHDALLKEEADLKQRF